MYNLTGEHISRKEISDHVHYCRELFVLRHQGRRRLLVGDLEFARKLALVIEGWPDLDKAIQSLQKKEEAEKSRSETGVSVEDTMQRRRGTKDCAFLLNCWMQTSDWRLVFWACWREMR